MNNSKSVGSDTVWVRVPPPAPKKNAPMGAFFFGAKGSANLFTDLKAPALIEREGGTAMVPPSHFPLLAEGQACVFRVGAFFFGGAEGSANLFTDLKASTLIEREGRTRRWSSLHTSLSLRGRGLCISSRGVFFGGAEGNAAVSLYGQGRTWYG